MVLGGPAVSLMFAYQASLRSLFFFPQINMGVENTVLFMLIILSYLPPNQRFWIPDHGTITWISQCWSKPSWYFKVFPHMYGSRNSERFVFKCCLLTYFTMPMWVRVGKIIVAIFLIIILTKLHTIYNNNKLCSFGEIVKVELFSDARHTTNEHSRRKMAVSHLNYLHCPFSKNYFVYLEKCSLQIIHVLLWSLVPVLLKQCSVWRKH